MWPALPSSALLSFPLADIYRSLRSVVPTRFGAVTSRSGRGRWERVLGAREQVRAAWGVIRSLATLSMDRPRQGRPYQLHQGPVWVAHGPGVTALSLGEAASKLGVSRADLEAMIAAGKVNTWGNSRHLSRRVRSTDSVRPSRLRLESGAGANSDWTRRVGRALIVCGHFGPLSGQRR
jgi:hypothetical protein